ncbi:MAG: hypothetical protein JSW70_04365 [Syntrophobacterales bacterium]|nr:MAG: hypothetical protein JSW70_04365 [Syntrophobacterales bacterium]
MSPIRQARRRTGVGLRREMVDRRIKVTVGEGEVYGELNETKTTDLIWKSLPIEAQINTWGDEIRPASPVNVFGRVIEDTTLLKDLKKGGIRPYRGRGLMSTNTLVAKGKGGSA